MTFFGLKKGPGGTPSTRIPKSTPRDNMCVRANADHHQKGFTSLYAYLPTEIPVTADCGSIQMRRVYHGEFLGNDVHKASKLFVIPISDWIEIFVMLQYIASSSCLMYIRSLSDFLWPIACLFSPNFCFWVLAEILQIAVSRQWWARLPTHSDS